MCPIWPGHPLQVHWGFKDPSAAEGDKIAKRKAFDELIKTLKPKIEKLIRLPVTTMDTVNLKFKPRHLPRSEERRFRIQKSHISCSRLGNGACCFKTH